MRPRRPRYRCLAHRASHPRSWNAFDSRQILKGPIRITAAARASRSARAAVCLARWREGDGANATSSFARGTGRGCACPRGDDRGSLCYSKGRWDYDVERSRHTHASRAFGLGMADSSRERRGPVGASWHLNGRAAQGSARLSRADQSLRPLRNAACDGDFKTPLVLVCLKLAPVILLAGVTPSYRAQCLPAGPPPSSPPRSWSGSPIRPHRYSRPG